MVSAAIAVVLLFVWALLSIPPHPVVLLRVVDASGKPIAGAVIVPDGLRPKAGAADGHYGWRSVELGVTNSPVVTDAEGFARVPYPKYISERIETGQISFSVNHPDYVSDRPFRMVATAPPAGAPWKIWWANLLDRLRRKTLIVRPDPVMLQKGAILKITARRDSAGPADTPLYAQVSGDWPSDTNYWLRPEPGVLLTRRLAPGPQLFRALRVETNGTAWFSEIINLNAVSGRTNQFEVTLKPGASVHGRLDDNVPRPVTNGRVIAHVSQSGQQSEPTPPGWHAWSIIRADGSFDLPSLPPGKLGIVALCDGFVSTNGPGTSGTFTYPQIHRLKAKDLDVLVGMQPTARLEVKVVDPAGKPLKDAKVSTWPNVLYEQWGSTILASDCYNSAAAFHDPPLSADADWSRTVPGFQGRTDSNGVAVMANLPEHVSEFAVEHPEFALPAINTSWGEKRRYASVTLRAGITNYANVQLERLDQSPIKHY